MTRVVLAAIFVLFANLANAATLYVNNSGSPACSDSTAKASNSASSPWCSIMRAAWGSTNYAAKVSGEAAAAGDVVMITAGTYTTTSGNTTASGSRFTVQLNPVNSGTAGNLITFRGVGTVDVRTGQSGGLWIHGPMIGCNTVNYIAWDNITIDDTYGGSVGDTGPVVFYSSTGCQLINSTVQGHSGSFNNGDSTFTDNYNAVRVEVSDSTLIRNNTLSRVWGLGTSSGDALVDNHNNAIVMLYNSDDTIIEHNVMSDAGAAVFIKGIQGGTHLYQRRNIIRFNHIYSVAEGIFDYFSEDSKGYQNVMRNIRRTGLHLGGGTTTGPLTNNAVRAVYANNTIYNAGDALSGQCVSIQGPYIENLTVKNNLCTDSRRGFGSLWDNTPAGYSAELHFDRNLYYGNAGANAGDWAGTAMSLATWQGTYSQDANASTSDPLYVNGGGSYALATDFKLQGGSPASTLGIDILDLDGDSSTVDTIPSGAYVIGTESIGLVASSGSTGISGGVSIIGGVRIQ